MSSTITTASAQPDYNTLEAAANWFATLQSDTASTADHQAWQAWLNQSEAHAKAWSYIETVSQRFDPLRSGGHQAALAGIQAAQRGGSRRRQALAGLASVVGLGIAGWMGWRHTALPEVLMAWEADYQTSPGEQREITLDDGSQVWLNTHSAISVHYHAGARLLQLVAGEILVETAQDPNNRPFYVETRFGRLQALGTRFSVFHDDRRTRLDVFESAVEIRNAAGSVQRVEAGERAAFTADNISAILPAERAREAWRRGLVVADNIPLEALINDLARYQHGHLGVAAEVAKLSVMGVYPANDIERALTMLESALPIRVKRSLSWWVTVEARS
ncbi:FecR domain-containing protein [Rhodoferax sp. U11-2br]|uniref:FecR domain-containing protein n=1 Tax=Rhodoferax sp. U11-2br TaxID=2838878 RepID=UPI001BEBDDA1|nr:FecR domain-containing protein [Rhodoferax sp. U11-2br]MBT3066241.1 FecR domain-containing protein [Rhodoferax sp. U11-2br]